MRSPPTIRPASSPTPMADEAPLEASFDESDLQTVYGALKRAFREAAIPTPDLDARVLVTETLGVTTAQLIANPRLRVSREQAELVYDRARLRVSGQSIGRILGRRAFWSLDLALGPGTLEPRPETETVVELCLALLQPADEAVVIADLGVGSGAIMLSILAERPNAFGVGLDISITALAEARRNAERHQLSPRAVFAAGNYAAPLGLAFDLIVSNPPYIASAVIETLSPTVRDHDPRLALDGGPDGLAAYRTVFAQTPAALKPNAPLIVEIDPAAYEAVVEEAARNHLDAIHVAHDLAGERRAVALLARSG